jgi:hypothetical protein
VIEPCAGRVPRCIAVPHELRNRETPRAIFVRWEF